MAEDYRNKYLDLLDEQEQQQKQWEQKESALKHSLNRVSLFADGLTPDLDRCLKNMRDLIRSKGKEQHLEPILNQLAEKLSQFEASSGSDYSSSTQVVTFLLENVEWPKHSRDTVKAVKLSLKEHPFVDELPVVLNQFSKLCVESFALPQEGEASGGLFGKLFSRNEQAQEKQELNQLAYQILENVIGAFNLVEQRGELMAALRACANESDMLDVSERVVAHVASLMARGSTAERNEQNESDYLPSANELFVAMLDRMSLPAELEPSAQQLKEKLDGPLSTEQWPDVMDKICDLIAMLRRKAQQEKQDIERFLSGLTESLKELDDRVKGASVDHKTSRESGQELNTVVQAQMSGLVSSMQQTSDLDVLKHSVQEHVELIRTHMESYQVQEEERYRNTVERMRILNERLHHLEQESDSLRARVREQRNQALRDTLTGINNRLAYDERVEMEYSRWKRFRSPVSLMIWDVDHFKKVNDTYGHQAGDKVLVAIARLLSSQIRESDFLARYGGEEFVLIAPGANIEEAMSLAEKLRKKIESSQFKHGDDEVPVTVSCGLVEFQQGYTLEQLFEAADKALYQAKVQGRNLCMCAELDN